MNAADVVSQRVAAGDYYGALQEIQRLEALPRKCLDPLERQLLLFEAGRARLYLGDYHLAEEALREFVAEAEPSGRGAAQALLNLALATLHQSRPAEAARQFARALAANPAATLVPTIRYGRAWALLEAGDLAGARTEIQALREVARCDSDRRDADLCTAFERLLAGDLLEAHSVAGTVVLNQRSDVRQQAYGQWLLAEIALAAGEVESARHLCKNAVALASNPPRPWLLNRLQLVRQDLDQQEKGVS